MYHKIFLKSNVLYRYKFIPLYIKDKTIIPLEGYGSNEMITFE